MKHIQTSELIRISKRTAKRIYYEGATIYITKNGNNNPTLKANTIDGDFDKFASLYYKPYFFVGACHIPYLGGR